MTNQELFARSNEDAILLKEEFAKATAQLCQYPTIYIGRDDEYGGSHLTIETRDWTEKMRARDPFRNPEGVRSAINLANQFSELGKGQYEHPTKASLHDRFLHGQPVPGELILKEGNTLAVRSITGRIQMADERHRHFLKGDPFTTGGLPDSAPSPDEEPGRAHLRTYPLLVNASEVEAFSWFDDVAKAIASHPAILVTPDQQRELEDVVRHVFGEDIDDVSFFRQHKNTTYHLRLKSGWHGILKEFGEETREKAGIDYFFSHLLSQQGLAPDVKRAGNRMFSTYAGERSLSTLSSDDPVLATQYAEAIKILLALERLSLPQELGRLHLPRIDEAHYLKKCGAPYDPKRTAHYTIIPADFLPTHLLIGPEGRLQVIDLEDISYGPVEYALATLFIHPYHALTPEFIGECLEQYADAHQGIDKKLLFSCFVEQATLVRQRVERRLHRRPESEKTILARRELQARQCDLSSLLK
jgi:hypothetical protein